MAHESRYDGGRIGRVSAPTWRTRDTPSRSAPLGPPTASTAMIGEGEAGRACGRFAESVASDEESERRSRLEAPSSVYGFPRPIHHASRRADARLRGAPVRICLFASARDRAVPIPNGRSMVRRTARHSHSSPGEAQVRSAEEAHGGWTKRRYSSHMIPRNLSWV
jgi:hypothetical protein